MTTCPRRWLAMPFIAILAWQVPSRGYALAVAGYQQSEALSTSPLLLLSYGWTGGDIYDLWLELRADCTSEPIRLLFPTAEMVTRKSAANTAPDGASGTTASIWLSYDLKNGSRYAPCMVKQSFEPAPAALRTPRAAAAAIQPGWSDYVDVIPGRSTKFQLRFRLPAMKLDRHQRPDQVPETFTLTIKDLDLGCGRLLRIRRAFPLHGREALLSLGPRAA